MRKILYIIPLFLAFTFTGGPPSGWYQQTLPDIGNRPIADMFFLDSLTGWIVTQYIDLDDTAYVLKTTDGGDNWNIANTRSGGVGFERIYFLNQNTGFVCGANDINSYSGLSKSTNGGINWTTLNVPDPFVQFNDMYVYNEDTIWLAAESSGSGGIFRTVNGGLNWDIQYSGLSNPNKIYMVNKDSGFAADGTRFRRTTNSGMNWTLIAGQDGFQDMHFVDNSTGWKCNGNMKKTTDGGTTWVEQTLPSGSGISESVILKFDVLNKDTIWGVGARTPSRGLIYVTTNGGEKWDYQFPDFSINIFRYYHIDFINKNNGWAYAYGQTGVHTVTGGITSIHHLSSEIPQSFNLYQNYPNPFNPTTIITYDLIFKSEVKLTIFDLSGKEVEILVNKVQSPGTYQYTYDGSKLSAGVYFYQIKTGGSIETKKMILVK